MSVKLQRGRVRTDRRIERTRDRLGDALIALMQERAFEEVTVQDVLERAGVARSTFYKHYRDKNDLLLSDAGEFFEDMATFVIRSGEESDRLVAAKEFFAHLRDAKNLYGAIVRAGRANDLMDLARDHFARGIEERLKSLEKTREVPPDALRLQSNALAGALTALVSWWLSTNMRATPEDLDRQFHQLAWRGISRTTSSQGRS
jgi:AcrR family transcriptional regulator